MAGLLDSYFGGSDGGILGGNPSFSDNITGALTNPLTLFGLGMASGKTPQEGMGNAARLGIAGAQMQYDQRSQQAAYQAALAQGATPEQAKAVALNPAAFKAMQPQYHSVKQGLFGEETPMLLSPFGNRLTPIQQGQQGYGQQAGALGASAGLDTPRNAGALPESYDENGKDPEFLNSVEKQYGSTVAQSIVAITEGRMPAMGRNLQQLIPLAARYDKNFTGMQDYQTRLKTATSFAPGGKDYGQVKSYNQALIHADQAWNLIPRIAISDVGGKTGAVINALGGEYKNVMDPQYQQDRKNYDVLVEKLGTELSKAAKATGVVSVDEVRSWKQAASGAQSGPEMRGAIKGGVDFLHGAIEATAKGKAEGLKSQLKDPTDLLDAPQKRTFDRIRDYEEGKKGKTETKSEKSDAKGMPPGARPGLNADGTPGWFIPDPNRPGKYLRINQ